MDISLPDVDDRNRRVASEDDRLEKLEATIATLQQDNAKLQQQLKDSALELQATVDEFVRTDAERKRLVNDIDEFVRVDLERQRLIKELQAAKRLAEENSRLISETYKKYDVALEGAKLGVWDWNLLTNDVIYSERWVSMLGYNLDDLAPRFETFASLVHPDDLDRVVVLVNDYLAGKTTGYSVEMRMKTKSGGYHWVLASGKVFDHTPDGKPARMVGIHVDINERKRAEEGLTETYKKYDVALEGAKLGVWDWNLLTNDVIYSERWVSMLGYNLDDLAPRFETFASLVHPDDLDRVVVLVNDYLAGKTTGYSVEMRMKTKSGGYHWVLASGKVFDHTPDGKPARMVGIHVDINERKTAEKERELLIQDLQVAKRLAEENSRLKSEFLSTMSHELRTPMNAIEGFTSIMLSRMGGVEFNEKTERYITRVNVNSKRLLQLINDFLDLSRVESGRLELAHQPFSPADLARRWQTEISVLAEKKDIGFELSLDPHLPETVYGDEEAISKVALNLLSNAIKFTEQGKVSLSLTNGGGNWRIIVADTGIGIPPHAREYVFEEFRQVDQTSKRKYGGTGLGLAIVQKYTRTMGGSVLLQSELGAGSTFTVTLPLESQLEPMESKA